MNLCNFLIVVGFAVAVHCDGYERELEHSILGLKTDLAAGWIKSIKYVIVSPLTHIINLCFSLGVFPEVFKRSIIHPVHKSGTRDSFLKPCYTYDIKCLNKSTKKFLEKTCKGIEAYDIRAIDPLIIPSLEIEVDKDVGLLFSFKNLNVTGLGIQKISEFKLNKITKKVLLKTKADLHIVGDLTIKLTKDSKTFSGLYCADSTVLGTSKYSYELKKDAANVEYFQVGPETIEVESVTDPTVSLSAELQTALANDPEAQSRLHENSAQGVSLRKKVISELAKQGYVNVVHNIRASAKFLPKSAFFHDV